MKISNRPRADPTTPRLRTAAWHGPGPFEAEEAATLCGCAVAAIDEGEKVRTMYDGSGEGPKVGSNKTQHRRQRHPLSWTASMPCTRFKLPLDWTLSHRNPPPAGTDALGSEMPLRGADTKGQWTEDLVNPQGGCHQGPSTD